MTRGDVALDIGARYGTYAKLLARLVGSSGAVHAFEPNPAHTKALGTLGRNVRVHALALSNESGRVALHIPLGRRRADDGLATLGRPDQNHETISVERRRLDDFNFRRIDFVKCDVEGHELAVLRGGEQTLRQLLPPLLVEIEERHGADVGATFEFADSLGYRGYALFPDGLRPLADFNLDRDQLTPLARSSGWMMKPDYVHDFLFVAAGQRPPPVGAARRRSGRAFVRRLA